MRNLPRITARLEALGLGPLLARLQSGSLPAQEDYGFGNLATAKQVQSALYNWLWFFPAIKATVSIRLNTETATLSILPRGKTEKRGRRRLQ